MQICEVMPLLGKDTRLLSERVLVFTVMLCDLCILLCVHRSIWVFLLFFFAGYIAAVDRGWLRQFECYWNLSMIDFWYRPVPVFECHRRRLKGMNAIDSLRRRSSACKCVRRHKWERCINLGLLTVGLLVYTVKYGGAIFFRSIVSIVFLHGCIVPSLDVWHDEFIVID